MSTHNAAFRTRVLAALVLTTALPVWLACPHSSIVCAQAAARALHIAAGRRNAAYRAKALAALDKVLQAADEDLYASVCDLLMEGCLAAGKPPPPKVSTFKRDVAPDGVNKPVRQDLCVLSAEQPCTGCCSQPTMACTPLYGICCWRGAWLLASPVLPR